MERKSFLLSAAAMAALAASNPLVAKAQMNASDQNIMAIRRRINSYVDQLQHDQRDFGGHKDQAVHWLERADSQLAQALQFDKTHGPG